MNHCQNCPHKNNPICLPNLPEERCDLLIVGEGPGAEEIRLGQPFVGPSGNLLRSTLGLANLPNETVVGFTNATLCRSSVVGDKVTDQMILGCRQRVLEEIDSQQPRVVLALGNSAMLSVTGQTTKITQVHGNAFPLNGDGGPIVLPCLHPAAVLRKGSDFSRFKQAVSYAVQLVAGHSIKAPAETKYKVAREENFVELVQKLRELPEGTPLGCDIETTGLNPRIHQIVAIGLAWTEGRVIILPGSFTSRTELKELFECSHLRFIWHNGKFDASFLNSAGIPARVDEDVMLLHYALNEVKGTHDLEQLAGEFLGAADYKDIVGRYKKNGWRGCPTKILCEYLARDCDYTRQLWQLFWGKVSGSPNLLRLYERVLIPASKLLLGVERDGIYASPDELESVRSYLEPKQQVAYNRLQVAIKELWPNTTTYRRTGQRPPEVNPNSWKQVSELLYTHMGLRVPQGYAANTREETLNVLPPNPVTEAIIEYREAAKAIGTYVDGIRERIDPTTGRVHSTYLIHGTVTGRLSSRNPNMQNIPRDPRIRGIFQAPEGRWLLETDLDQAELRVLANLSKDPGLIEIYNAGRKLHHEVAVEMYGEGYTQDQYFRAKAINFGIMYGRGPASLVREFGGPNIPRESRLSAPEAKRLVRAWFDRFPVAYRFVMECRAAASKGTPLISPTGRVRRFGLITKHNLNELENEAANFPIQSTASDITLISGYLVRPLARSLGAAIVNLVHDSIVFEVPQDMEVVSLIAKQAAGAFRTTGFDLVGDAVPFLSEFKLGTKWGSLEKVAL